MRKRRKRRRRGRRDKRQRDRTAEVISEDITIENFFKKINERV